MPRDRLIAILLALAAIPLGVALMAAPVLFPALPQWVLGSLFCGGLILGAALIAAAIIIAVRDEEESKAQGKGFRFWPVIVIAVAVLAIGVAAWKLWPKAAHPIRSVASVVSAPPKAVPVPPATVQKPSPPLAPPRPQPTPAAISPTPAKPSRLVIECHDGFIPDVPVGVNDRMYVMYLPQGPNSSVSLAEQFILTGGVVRMHEVGKSPMSGYTCLVTNYGDSVLINVKINVNVKAWKTVANGNGMRGGDFDYEETSSIVIPKIETTRPYGFVFYTFNLGKNYEEFSFLDKAETINLDTESPQMIDVVSTNGIMKSWPQPGLVK